jgi:hypothetical protein
MNPKSSMCTYREILNVGKTIGTHNIRHCKIAMLIHIQEYFSVEFVSKGAWLKAAVKQALPCQRTSGSK